MPHDNRARFLGRRARTVLEEGEDTNEWELGSVVSQSTRSSAVSTTSAGSRSESSSDEETVNDDCTEVGGSSDGDTTRSIGGDVSLGEAMEVDTAGWNEDAGTPAAQAGEWEATPVLRHAAFTPATAGKASHRTSLRPAQNTEQLGPPNTPNFAITITPSPSPGPHFVLSLAKPSASEPVASLSPLVSPSVSSALSPSNSISPVSSVRSGLVERPHPLQMAGSIKILKRSLSAISIGQPQPKAAEIGTEKPVLNEEEEKTRLGARGRSSQNELEGDEDEKSQCSEKRPEVVTPTPTQTAFLPTEPSQIEESTSITICLARSTALLPREDTRKEVSLTENPESTPDVAAEETCVTPTPPQSVGGIGLPITLSASAVENPTISELDEDARGAFASLWNDLNILVREMQELSITIEKSAEAGRLEKTATSGAQVSKKSSIHKVREVTVVADAVNSQPVMNEDREAPITLVDLEAAASPSVRENTEITLRVSSKSAGLTKDSAGMARSLEIQSEQPNEKFWKNEHIGQWVAMSAIPSEKTRTHLLTKE